MLVLLFMHRINACAVLRSCICEICKLRKINCHPNKILFLLDVDECVDGTNNCNWTTHSCVNTQGGYMCQEKSGSTDCIAGYKFSDQQKKCIGMYFPVSIKSGSYWSSAIGIIRFVYFCVEFTSCVKA